MIRRTLLETGEPLWVRIARWYYENARRMSTDSRARERERGECRSMPWLHEILLEHQVGNFGHGTGQY